MADRIRRFLDEHRPPTPCLVVDLDVVGQRFSAIRNAFSQVDVFYAVKANPSPEVIGLLAARGCAFDVASVAEVDLCLSSGAAASALSYGNTIKKAADIAYAYGRGVRLFVSDSAPDVRSVAAHAPGSTVLIRVRAHGDGAVYPFGAKFGCSVSEAAELRKLAASLGLDAPGVAFHVGSQQLDGHGWAEAVADAARLPDVRILNLGGGLPAVYRDPIPPLEHYADAIEKAVDQHFPDRPRLMIEPGRAVTAEAGVIRSTVVLVAERDGRRWVYLDIGRYQGLAETEGEAIAYPLRTSRDGGPAGPVVIAGPTCDADDVIYAKTPYDLPLDLQTGDHVDFLSAGAYTASYASVAFNGFGPLPTYCIRG